MGNVGLEARSTNREPTFKDVGHPSYCRNMIIQDLKRLGVGQMLASLPLRRSARFTLFLCIASLCIARSATAQHLYWLNDEGIHRANTDGTDAVTILPDAWGTNLSLDVQRGHIYWSHYGCFFCIPWSPGEILRANLDGTEWETVISDVEFDVYSFTIDPVAKKLYWGGMSYGDVWDAAPISSATFSGGDLQRLIYTWPGEMAVDPIGQELYWIGLFGLAHAPLNGTTSCESFGPWGRMYDLLVDICGRRLYWSEDGRIMRSRLDGSGAEEVIETPTGRAWRIALDSLGRKIYWLSAGSIRRGNLDGTGEEEVLSAQPISDFAIDPGMGGTCNMDAQLTLCDHAGLVKCLDGPGRIPSRPACAFFDRDPRDGDVDLADYARFQHAMTGLGK